MLQPLEETVDHVRGPAAGHLILEYGDYECPYSRAAYREIEKIERRQLLFHRQKALEDEDLRRYAAELELNVARSDHDTGGAEVLGRIERDVESAIATGEVRGTPTLYIDGVLHVGSYDADTLLQALAE